MNNDTSIINPRHMSTRDLAAFGVQDLAFIKAVSVNDEVGYAIHAADGTQMALVNDRDVAFAAVRQHGLEPVSVINGPKRSEGPSAIEAPRSEPSRRTPAPGA